MLFVDINLFFTLFNPRQTSNSRMRLAKGFFLPLIAAGMRSKFCRPASGGRRPDVGPRFSGTRFVNINSFFTLFNPRRISNSRMRLAKGFFLPFIAAEIRSKFCRPASGGLPVGFGRRFSEMRLMNIY